MGLRFLVAKPHRLPQLNAVLTPEGVDEAKVRARLLDHYGIEIGAGLGSLAGKVWRIGLMGRSSTANNIILFLGALETILLDMGAAIVPGAAVQAAMGSGAKGGLT